MNILAVIPARGGSKGVSRKNLREVGGIPLVIHALKSALPNSDILDVLISTDDEEIADLCRKAGGAVPFIRPADLSSDTAATWQVLQHAVKYQEQETGIRVDAIVTLQPTAPFRTDVHVREAVQFFCDNPGRESLISTCSAEQYHPLTLYTKLGKNLCPLLKDLDPNTRRQNFPPVYWRNGAIYITSRDFLFACNRTTSNQPLMYEMPAEISVNIDSEKDLDYANFLWSSLNKNNEIKIRTAAN